MIKENISIKNILLKNRAIAAPIVTNSWDDNASPTLDTLEVYKAYAKSGAGLIVAEQHAVHPWGRVSLK